MPSRKSTKTRPRKKNTSRQGSSKRKAKTKKSAAAALPQPSPEPDPTIKEAPDLPALLHYIRQGRCALFVGAGLSAGAGLPTWRGLMTRIIGEATPFAVPHQKAEVLAEAKKRHEKLYLDVENPLSQREMINFFTKLLGRDRCNDLFGPKGSINLSNSTAYREALARLQQDTETAKELTSLLDAGKFAELAGYCRDLLGGA